MSQDQAPQTPEDIAGSFIFRLPVEDDGQIFVDPNVNAYPQLPTTFDPIKFTVERTDDGYLQFAFNTSLDAMRVLSSLHRTAELSWMALTRTFARDYPESEFSISLRDILKDASGAGLQLPTDEERINEAKSVLDRCGYMVYPGSED